MLVKNPVFWWLFLFSAYSHASCDEEYTVLVGEVYKDKGIARLDSTCKGWGETGLFIVVTSVYVRDRVDLAVLVVEPKSKKIVARMRDTDALTGTAIYNSGLRIDAVSYKLGHDVLAFGILTSWQNSSSPNPYSFESLGLYVVQAESVVGVLHGLNMEVRSGEWDTRCSGEFATREMELSVLPMESSYADLMVGEKFTSSSSRQTAEGCKKLCAMLRLRSIF